MTQKTTLYLGLNDKDTKVQKIDTIESYKVVENTLLSNGISAYTIYSANGVYKHDSGVITIEQTLVIILLDTDTKLEDKVIGILKQVFNQECIGVERQSIALSFE